MCTYIYTFKAYSSLKKITDCSIYYILSNEEVIKYHQFISVVVIELSVNCLNTGILCNGDVIKYHQFISVVVIELSFNCLNTGPENLYSEQ